MTSAAADDVPGRDPRDWQFLGSNDGTNWTVLDTQTDETFVSRYLTKQYLIANSTPYRYYRLNITANNGDAVSLQLSELALMTYDYYNGEAGITDLLELAAHWLSLDCTDISCMWRRRYYGGCKSELVRPGGDGEKLAAKPLIYRLLIRQFYYYLKLHKLDLHFSKYILIKQS